MIAAIQQTALGLVQERHGQELFRAYSTGSAPPSGCAAIYQVEDAKIAAVTAAESIADLVGIDVATGWPPPPS